LAFERIDMRYVLLVMLVVAGMLTPVQMATNKRGAMAIDHFGLLGMRRDAINWYKVGGAALLVAGAALMQIRSE
jgi:uncharacterized membrane protein YdcZ (DUF606 family)